MDSRDRLRTSSDGVACAACRSPVPAEDVRLLAQRDDLAFIELTCPTCSSTGLAIVVGAGSADARILDDHDGPADGRAPIGPEDVLDMHLLLASWQGDLRTLLLGAGASRDEAGR